MAMWKSAAEWTGFILLFLSIVQGPVRKVEAGVMKVSVHSNPTMNSSDWSNVVLQSKHRAQVLISRLHPASGNSNSTYFHRLSASANVPVVSGNSDGTSYIVNVGFGTPPKQNMKMNFDTASDVSWLRCDYSARSSTYKRLDCKSCYRQVEGVACNGQDQCILQAQYINGNQIMAHMSQDTLWLGSQSLPNFRFGCGYNFNGFQGNASIGRLALGRNSLSLPSQERRRVFSYCLPDFLNPKGKGSLTLGDAASIPSTSKFTALMSNPMATSWYFVGITGISVGGTRLNIPPKIFQFNSRGGGTIVDSGVLITQLAQPAYNALRAAFLNQMKLSPRKAQPQLPLETCFTYSGDIAKLQIPPITFHFQDGLNLPINQRGILAPVSEDVICLAFQPSTSNDLNVIGTLQQQGYTISFEQDRKRIGFAPVRTCA